MDKPLDGGTGQGRSSRTGFRGIVTDRDAVERVWRRITREIAGERFPTAEGGDSRIDVMNGGYVQHQ